MARQRSNVIHLTAHRNTKLRRQRQEAQKYLLSEVRRMATSSDCRAFVLVIFDEDGSARTLWDTGSIIPQFALPATIENVLRRDMDDNSGPDDHIPPEKRK